MTLTVNLNGDLGESYGRYVVGDDAALLRIIKSASIACGFHGGDPDVMAQAVRLAVENGASIGAHPSFNDVQGFGRRQVRMRPREIENLVCYQIGALQGIAAAGGARVTHVKPHGALNNMAHTDPEYAGALARAIRAVDRDLIFVANACSEMVKAGHALGLRVAEEAYADRVYDDEGRLASRERADAMIRDPEVATRQVLAFLDAGGIVTGGGRKIPTRIHTFCAHGDEPSGVAVMSSVRRALEAQGVRIAPLPELDYS